MAKINLVVTLERRLLSELDRLVSKQRFTSRSQAIESAVAEKVARMDKKRLPAECAKLDRDEEKALAEEGFSTGRSTYGHY